MAWWEPLAEAAPVLLGAFAGGLITIVAQRRAFQEQREAKLNEYRAEVYARVLAELRRCLRCVNAGTTFELDEMAYHETTALAGLIASPNVQQPMGEAVRLCSECMMRSVDRDRDFGLCVTKALEALDNLNRAMRKEMGTG